MAKINNQIFDFEFANERYIAEYDGGAIINGIAKDKYVISLDRTAEEHAYYRVDTIWIKRSTLKRDVQKVVRDAFIERSKDDELAA